jgi:MYXO-CTERM domain-containing protein
MRNSILLLAALTVWTTCGLSMARANDNPLHNPNNSYDVDDNGSIQPRDFLLVVNQLLRSPPGNAAPLVTTGATYYWDTNDDSQVTDVDAFGIADHLSNAVSTPEPSTFISAALGLVFLAGYAWRRRRRRA